MSAPASSRFGPPAAAYTRKMEFDPEETPDFSPFSKMRRMELDPESVIGRELHDRFAEFDESFTGKSRIWSVVVKLIGLTAMCSQAVIDLEKQVIELRTSRCGRVGRASGVARVSVARSRQGENVELPGANAIPARTRFSS